MYFFKELAARQRVRQSRSVATCTRTKQKTRRKRGKVKSVPKCGDGLGEDSARAPAACALYARENNSLEVRERNNRDKVTVTHGFEVIHLYRAAPSATKMRGIVNDRFANQTPPRPSSRRST